MNSPNKLPPRRGEFSFKLEKILLVCQTKAFKKKVAKICMEVLQAEQEKYFARDEL